MRAQQLGGILVLLTIIVISVSYKAATNTPQDAGLQAAQLKYEMEKLELRQRNLKRYDSLKYYGIMFAIAALNLSLLTLVGAYARAKMKDASVHTAHIGERGAIPVHYKNLKEFYPIAANLSMAELEAASSSAHENAYQISRRMIEDVTGYTRAIAGKRGLVLPHVDVEQAQDVQNALEAVTTAPDFSELLSSGVAAPGKPIVMGFHQGEAQYRSLQDLKSLAVAGWQGSGKTMSTAYIVAASVLAYGVQVYIVDPHKNHDEGLYTKLKPLEKTRHVTFINPFDTPTLIQNLNQTLDRRLAGEEASSPGILLVIDELARLAKMECFDVLVSFLERCTEETRKANITFIGGSHKWTARHFKGRADIRGCMNSMLIHKTKPSQADLLLEDSQDKHLVKQIDRPGEGILATDFSSPILVAMPRCTQKDMERVADTVQKSYTVPVQELLRHDRLSAPQQASKRTETRESTALSQSIPAEIRRKGAPQEVPVKTEKTSSPQASVSRNFDANSETYPKDVIPFNRARKNRTMESKSSFHPSRITLEQIQEQFRQRQEEDTSFTQKELARQVGLSVGHLGNILRGKRPLTTQNKAKLYNVLFLQEEMKKTAIRG